MWRRERGVAGCKLTAGFDKKPKNFVREIDELYINDENLTTIRVS